MKKPNRLVERLAQLLASNAVDRPCELIEDYAAGQRYAAAFALRDYIRENPRHKLVVRDAIRSWVAYFKDCRAKREAKKGGQI